MHCLQRFILPGWTGRYQPSGALNAAAFRDGIKFAASFAGGPAARMQSNNNAALAPEPFDG
jgi:hypothetical protein